VQHGGGPLQALLTDTTAARHLRQTMRNTAQSSVKLNQSMTALQHSFLLRGYFRRKAACEKARRERQARDSARLRE
jgi:phospholipid/cholesterol/gamma-HCH transport system substrate-binding protein